MRFELYFTVKKFFKLFHIAFSKISDTPQPSYIRHKFADPLFYWAYEIKTVESEIGHLSKLWLDFGSFEHLIYVLKTNHTTRINIVIKRHMWELGTFIRTLSRLDYEHWLGTISIFLREEVSLYCPFAFDNRPFLA